MILARACYIFRRLESESRSNALAELFVANCSYIMSYRRKSVNLQGTGGPLGRPRRPPAMQPRPFLGDQNRVRRVLRRILERRRLADQAVRIFGDQAEQLRYILRGGVVDPAHRIRVVKGRFLDVGDGGVAQPA